MLAIINATIGRIIVFLSAPFLFLTLGLFIFIINAFLLQLMAKFVSGIKFRDFSSAVITSLLMTAFTWLANIIF